MAFEYAPAPESAGIADIRPSYGLFVNGEFADPVDGSQIRDDPPLGRS